MRFAPRRPGDGAARQTTSRSTPGSCSVPTGNRLRSPLLPELRRKPPMPASYGAHAAHVAVDPKTGHVELLDYVAVEDAGRIINPLTLHGQVVGTIVQGLGGAFLEHFVYDEDGQLLTGSLADYLLPTASDFPRIRAIALEEKPSPNN